MKAKAFFAFACSILIALVAAPARGVITVPGTQEIADLNEHELFTNGIDKGADGTKATIPSFGSDSWTVMIKNTSNMKWWDFEIKTPGAGVGFNSEPPFPTVSGGFGGTTDNPAPFTWNDFHNVRIVVTDMNKTVMPGDTIKLNIPVISGSGQEQMYNLVVQASVPEPSSLLSASAGFLLVLTRRRVRVE